MLLLFYDCLKNGISDFSHMRKQRNAKKRSGGESRHWL